MQHDQAITDIIFRSNLLHHFHVEELERNWGQASQVKMDEIKGKRESRSKRISNIRKLYIKFLKRFTDLSNKEIADLHEIGSSAVNNVLRGRYKENDFMVKSSIEIDKNVKL